MADIHIERQHGMTLAQARQTASTWADQAAAKFDMTCSRGDGEVSNADDISFKRSGVTGTLAVTAEVFELNVKLGFLLGAFKDQIEGEIIKNLDALIAKKSAERNTGLQKA